MARGLFVGVAVLALLVAGCTGGGSGATVSNQPGHFSYSVGGARSGTDTYSWQNPSASARVQFSGGGTGSVMIKITDSAGRETYSNTFAGSGGTSTGGPTMSGVPGTWTIVVSVNGAGGFTLQVDAS
jgi:hypothetical protein